MLEDCTSQDLRIGRIISDYLDRRARGEQLSEEQLLAEHPDVAEQVRQELRTAEILLRNRAGEDAILYPGAVTLPTDSFPGYEILGEAHRGGQGVVYKALQKSTRRKVAIKIMRESPFAGSPDEPRFRREVQILGALKHPRIVTIHDSGVAHGRHYFVMDYISGQPLDVWVAGSTRSVESILRLFLQICEAVNAAHLKGIIHRDLKPGNIRVDEEGEPHILDFGLAKIGPTSLDHSSQLTMTELGQFVGSVPWASPEQAAGDPDRIDTRTDVYSLGVILYQMLTGRFPYDVVGPLPQVLDRIARAEPVRPSLLRREVDLEIETILLTCLRKEPERRYQTAGELGRDIARYLNGEPIDAKRDSTFYVLKKTLRRHRAGFAASVAFVMLICISLAVSISLWQKAATERDRAILAEREQSEQRTRADSEALQAQQAQQAAEAGQRRLQEQAERLARTVYTSRISMAQNAFLGNDFSQALLFLNDCRPDLRAWEWHYLRRLCTRPPIQALPVPKWDSAVFSPDGRCLAVASEEGGIHLLDTSTGKTLASFTGYAGFGPLALSLQGQYLAARRTELHREILVLLDTQSRSEKAFPMPERVTGLAIAADASLVAVSTKKGPLIVLDAVTGKELSRYQDPFYSQECLAFSPDGTRIAVRKSSRLREYGFAVIDASSGHELLTREMPQLLVQALAWSPDGQRIAVGSVIRGTHSEADGTLKLFDSRTGEELFSARGHQGSVESLAFSPDGSLLASGGYQAVPREESPDQTVAIWDASTGAQIHNFSAHAGGGRAVSWTPDGNRILSLGLEGFLKAWPRAGHGVSDVLRGHSGMVMNLAFSPDGQRLLSCSTKPFASSPDAMEEFPIRIWNVQDQTQLLGIPLSMGLLAAAWTPDGDQIITGGLDKSVRFWNSRTGKEAAPPVFGESNVRDVSVSPDGRWVAVAAGPAVRVLNIADQTEAFRIQGTGNFTTAAFSPDGRWLAAGGTSHQLAIHDGRNGKQVRAIQTRSPVRSARFSQDSRLLAWANYIQPYSVTVWDMESGTQMATLPHRPRSAQALDFSPDGQRLASTGADNMLRIWDIRDAAQAFVTRAHDSVVFSIAFNPDGTKIATSGQDGTIRLWDAAPLEDEVRPASAPVAALP